MLSERSENNLHKTIVLKNTQPNRINFKPNTLYTLDLTGTLSYGIIEEHELYTLFKDGRVTGRLIEKLLATLFKNIEMSANSNSRFDLVYGKYGQPIEVRTVSKSGTNTAPSHMIGKGRVYDAVEHTEKLKALGYFIFVCIRETPLLDVFAIPSGIHLKGANGKLTEKQVRRLAREYRE